VERSVVQDIPIVLISALEFDILYAKLDNFVEEKAISRRLNLAIGNFKYLNL
jgi:hypothetical protein